MTQNYYALPNRQLRKQIVMENSKYRIESSHPMVGPLLPGNGVLNIYVHDRALAIVVAAKSVTVPYGREIRVVHVPTGDIVFRKTAAYMGTGNFE
jgi:hypothetical protein